MKIESQHNSFYLRKWTWKCRLQHVAHCILASMWSLNYRPDPVYSCCFGGSLSRPRCVRHQGPWSDSKEKCRLPSSMIPTIKKVIVKRPTYLSTSSNRIGPLTFLFGCNLCWNIAIQYADVKYREIWSFFNVCFIYIHLSIQPVSLWPVPLLTYIPQMSVVLLCFALVWSFNTTYKFTWLVMCQSCDCTCVSYTPLNDMRTQTKGILLDRRTA